MVFNRCSNVVVFSRGVRFWILSLNVVDEKFNFNWVIGIFSNEMFGKIFSFNKGNGIDCVVLKGRKSEAQGVLTGIIEWVSEFSLMRINSIKRGIDRIIFPGSLLLIINI